MINVERRKKYLDSAIDDYREAIVDEARDDATQETQEGIVRVLRDLRSNHEDGSEGAKAMDEAIAAAQRWTP